MDKPKELEIVSVDRQLMIARSSGHGSFRDFIRRRNSSASPPLICGLSKRGVAALIALLVILLVSVSTVLTVSRIRYDIYDHRPRPCGAGAP